MRKVPSGSNIPVGTFFLCMHSPTFWGIFPQSFLTFHTIHFWHKTYKHLIINTKPFFSSFWHADCDYDDRVRQ